MSPIRIRNRGAYLWFLIPVLLMVLVAIVTLLGPPNRSRVAPVVIECIAGAILVLTLFFVKREVVLGDEIEFRYFLRVRRYSWRELAFVSFDRDDGSIRTGVPLVSIPTTNHVATFRFKNGHELSINIEPYAIPDVHALVSSRANLDHEGENRRQAEVESSNRRFDHLLFAAAGLAACVGGVWLSALLLDEVSDGMRSHKWPQAEGRISSAHTEQETVRERRSERTLYWVAVEYTYVVNDKEYSGNTFSFSPQKTEVLEDISRTLELLPPGQEIKVYYKPSDPSVSVLVPGVGTSRLILLGVAALAAPCGLVYSGYRLRKYLTERRSQAA
jgi:hypothetical protein